MKADQALLQLANNIRTAARSQSKYYPLNKEYLEECIETYLDTLSGIVPEATFQSHQTVLSSLRSWCWKNSISQEEMDEKLIACFIRNLIKKTDLNVTTVSGYLSPLTNFLAALIQDDPELVKIRVIKHFHDKRDSDVEEGKTQECGELLVDHRRSAIEENIESLRSYLRKRKFGSRTHAYVEILDDTKGRLEPVRQLNLENINLEDGTVEIGIPETHVVSSTGLVTNRVVELSPLTVDALQVYIDHERKKPALRNQKPLFTTTHGRASQSTLHRSTKKASEDAYRVQSKEPVTENQNQTVVPSDIRRYSISKALQK